MTFQNTDQTIFTLAQLDFQPSVYAETNTRFRVTARAANDNPIFYFYDIEKKKCSPAYSSNNDGLWNSDELILSFDKAGFYILELYSGVVVSKYVVDLEGVDSFLSCELNQNGNSLCVTYVEADGLTINEVIVPLAS